MTPHALTWVSLLRADVGRRVSVRGARGVARAHVLGAADASAALVKAAPDGALQRLDGCGVLLVGPLRVRTRELLLAHALLCKLTEHVFDLRVGGEGLGVEGERHTCRKVQRLNAALRMRSQPPDPMPRLDRLASPPPAQSSTPHLGLAHALVLVEAVVLRLVAADRLVVALLGLHLVKVRCAQPLAPALCARRIAPACARTRAASQAVRSGAERRSSGCARLPLTRLGAGSPSRPSPFPTFPLIRTAAGLAQALQPHELSVRALCSCRYRVVARAAVCVTARFIAALLLAAVLQRRCVIVCVCNGRTRRS